MTDFHHRGKFLQIVSLLLVSYFMLLFQSIAQERDPLNVLFIAVDDLRPELGAYGKAYAITPHMDRLASQSSLFTNHYVTVPTCGASRYSLLVGKLPQSRHDLSNMAAVHQLARKPESERRKTFIQDFREKGYYTVGIGKISHHPDGYVYEYDQPKSDLIELPGSWDEMLFNPGKWETGHNAFFGYADGSNRTDRNKQVKPYEMAEVSDDGYADGLSAQLAITKLQELKAKNQPFFLGVGFFKPHLPFTAPKKYWDLYDPEEIPLAPFPAIPQGSSRASLIQSGEFNQYALGEEKAGLDQAVSEDYARKLRHAYLASVSYVDAQIGKVLDELERLGLAENTVIVLWGDHGWHLGDQLVWGKHTLFESALRSVLMIKAPGIPAAKIKQVVSTLDIYPTLLDLTGNADDSDLDGKSLIDLMKNSQSENWRNTAYSYFNQGISLRTPTHRLTQYFRSESQEFELYDLIQDPNETQNIASYSPQVFGVLKALLDAGNTGLFEDQ